MEAKKYNPFVVIKPKSKPKVRPKAKIKLEAGGLSLENKKKLDIIYARGFVKTSKKLLSGTASQIIINIYEVAFLIRNCFANVSS